MKIIKKLCIRSAALFLAVAVMHPTVNVYAVTGGTGTNTDPYSGVCSITAGPDSATNAFTVSCDNTTDKGVITISAGTELWLSMTGSGSYGTQEYPLRSTAHNGTASDTDPTTITVSAEDMRRSFAGDFPADTYSNASIKIGANGSHYKISDSFVFASIRKTYPTDLTFTAVDDGTGHTKVEITAPSDNDFIDLMWTSSYSYSTDNDINFGTNIQFGHYQSDPKVGGYVPSISGGSYPIVYDATGTNHKLIIPSSYFDSFNIPSGTELDFWMQCRDQNYSGSVSQKVTVTTSVTAAPGDIAVAIDGNGNITITSADKAYLEAFKGFGITSTVSGTGVTSENFKASDLTLTQSGNNWVLTLDKNAIRIMYSRDLSSVEVKVNATGYGSFVKNYTGWTNPLKDSAYSMHVIGSGVLVYTADQDFADALKTTATDAAPNPFAFTGMSKLKIEKMMYCGIQLYNTNMVSYSYSPYDSVFQDAGTEVINGTTYYKVLIPVTKSDILKQCANFNFANVYNLETDSPDYFEDIDFSDNSTYSLKPIELLSNVQEANAASGNQSVSSLETLDLLATSALSDNNVSVSGVENNSSSSSVSVYGEVAGAITTDNSGDVSTDDVNTVTQTGSTEIAVTTTVGTLTEDADTMIADSGLTDAESTGTEFDVTIEKTKTGEQDSTVTELPYKAAITIDTSEIEVADDEELALVTEHNGETSVLPVTVTDGTGTAYTSQFSSFVLVKAKKPQVQEAVNSGKSSSESQWCVTFLDCKGNTVSVQWITTGQDASAPAGYKYTGYTNISSHRDLYPSSCGYTAPNTAAK